MKNTPQTNKIAGSGEQVLPGAAVSGARNTILPGQVSVIPVPARNEPLPPTATAVLSLPDSSAGRTVLADNAVAASSFSDVRSQALDRTHDLMALHATRMVSANSDSLQVVIKPDAGTQLSLELRQRGGGIEAQAVLQSGDFENLKQHWPELQQRLEERGIKLAPLTSDGNFATAGGHQGFKKQPDSPAEVEPTMVGGFNGFVPAGTATNVPAEPAISAASSRGWQTWA